MSIQERIREWMEAEGLTFLDVAKRVGCQPSTIHGWANGTEPKGLYLAKVERLLRKWERANA